MKSETSYYKILGVNQNASNHELRKAFCKLSIELHPDTTALEIDVAKSKFQEVLEAYEHLNNSNLRKIYDEKLKDYFPTALIEKMWKMQYCRDLKLLSKIV